MKIDRIQVIGISAGMKKPLRIAKMVREKSSSMIVKIHTDEGIQGFGEATFAHFFAGETLESARGVIEKHLAPVLTGRDPNNILLRMDEMDRIIHGNPFAKAAVETALWDIKGKVLGVPVYDLLGGRRRNKIPVCQSVGYGEAKDMIDEALERISGGFDTLKIYCGRESPRADLDRLRQIRSAVGDGISLYVEVNQRWSFKNAQWLMPRLEELNVLFVEQPIHHLLHRELKVLRETSPVPIALDEGVFSPADVISAKQRGLGDIMNIYVLKAGGIHNAKTALSICEAAGLDAFVGSFNELSVSTAAGVQVAATLGELPYPCYLVGPMGYEEDLLKQPLEIREGHLYVPDRPGLGIDVDEHILEKLREW